MCPEFFLRGRICIHKTNKQIKKIRSTPLPSQKIVDFVSTKSLWDGGGRGDGGGGNGGGDSSVNTLFIHLIPFFFNVYFVYYVSILQWVFIIKQLGFTIINCQLMII